MAERGRRLSTCAGGAFCPGSSMGIYTGCARATTAGPRWCGST
jgi:hypothetical protein